MKVSSPIEVVVPARGVCFAQSMHAEGFRMVSRADSFHKVVYVLDGRVGYEAGGASICGLGKGTVLTVPAGCRHVIVDESPATLLLLCLGRGFVRGDPELDEIWTGLAAEEGRVLSPSRPARLRLEAWWRAALLETVHARPGRASWLRATATQVLVSLARLPERRTEESAAGRVAAVAREVAETFCEEWDLDRAAARAGLSRRRFSSLFREACGTSFGGYLAERRLGHAARLLQAGESTILGVMFACGFNDLSHFYRLFRDRFGAPPREWVRRGRSGGGPETAARSRR